GPQNSDTVTIQDNDFAGFTLSQTALTTIENGATEEFTVVLTAEPFSDVVLNVVSGNPAEGDVGPSTLTFTPEDWDIPLPVTVTPVDDNIVDGPQSYGVTVSVEDEDSDDNFDFLSDQVVTVVNNDSVISLVGD